MPRRGENIYKRKDGRWEGRIPKRDGKYRYVYAKTYREVKEKRKNCLEQTKTRSNGTHIKAENPEALFEQWLNGPVAERVKPTTYENYYCCMKKYVIPFFRSQSCKRITELSTARFVEFILKNLSLSEPYKRKILSIFNTAVREILKGSPEYAPVIAEIVLPKAKGRTVEAFSVQEQRIVEKAVLESRDRRSLGILLCFYTGIRLGELCALKWGDIDFDAGTLSITKTVSRTKNFSKGENKTVLTVDTPKSEMSSRIIPIPIFLLNLFSNIKVHADENRFILSGTDTPIDPRTYQKLYKKMLAGAGVKDRKFHAIRHTFATRALELGVDIKTLSEILGHSNVSITLNIYAHSLIEQKRIAMEKLNEMHVNHMALPASAVTHSVSAV